MNCKFGICSEHGSILKACALILAVLYTDDDSKRFPTLSTKRLLNLPTSIALRTSAVLAVLIIGSFVVLNTFTLPSDNITANSIQNFGHFLLFMVLGFIALKLVLQLLQNHLLAILITTTVLVGLGLAVELFQKGQSGRTASTLDLALDIAGIVVGYLVLWGQFLWQKRAEPVRLLLVMIGAIVVTLIAAKPMIGLIGFDLFRSPLPIVREFDGPFALQKVESYANAGFERVIIELPDGSSVSALRLLFSNTIYSGVIFHESGKKWSEFNRLNIKIFSALPTGRQIQLRINDKRHNNQYSDRYNASFSISPGLNELLVPLASVVNMGENVDSDRKMDIDDVSRIQIFSSDVELFAIDIVKIELQ